MKNVSKKQKKVAHQQQSYQLQKTNLKFHNLQSNQSGLKTIFVV